MKIVREEKSPSLKTEDQNFAQRWGGTGTLYLWPSNFATQPVELVHYRSFVIEDPRLIGYGRMIELTGLCPPLDGIFGCLDITLSTNPAALGLAEKQFAAIKAKVEAAVASGAASSRQAGANAAAALFAPEKQSHPNEAGGTAAAASLKGKDSPSGQPPPR